MNNSLLLIIYLSFLYVSGHFFPRRSQVKIGGYPEYPELPVISVAPSVGTVQSVLPDVAEYPVRNVFFRNIRPAADGLPQFG